MKAPILIAAAILTPTPDVFTQLMLAGPLYLLYEISILLVKRLDRKRAAEKARVEAEESQES